MTDTKIKISAETARAEAAIKSLGQSILGLDGGMSILSRGAGMLGGALSISAFGAFIKNSVDAADRLDELSQQTGTSVEQLAGLKYAAEQNGASLDSVAKGAAKIAAAMTDNPALFERFGITAKDSTGALIQLADVFKRMPDGIEKSALATKLFGDRIGGEMVLFLNQGTKSMRKLVETGKELNPVTTESAAEAAKFKDRMDELKASAEGLGIKLSNILLPALNSIAKALLNTSGDPLKDLNIELETIQRRIKTSEGGGKLNQWLFGSKDELKQRESEILLAIEKVRAEAAKPKVTAVELDQTTGSGLLDALGGNGKGKKDTDKEQKNGLEVLRSLERDYQNELATRNDALNAPLLSASEKQLAEDLREVHKRAQDARVALEKQKASQGLGDAEYSARLAEVTAKEQEQVDAVKALQAAQDQLNGSWEYGAKIAMRKYIDEAQDVATLSEGLFANAFKGMGDALAQFVRTGKLDMRSLADSIINEIIRTQSQAAVAGIMGSLFGNGYGDKAGVAAGVPRYEGGGYTGSGSRSGGVDGKGGFVAIMHPNETVIDHVRGRSGGGSAQIVVNQSIINNINGQSSSTQIQSSSADFDRLAKRMGDVSKAAILEEMRPGGLLAR